MQPSGPKSREGKLMSWTDERIEQLKTLWMNGATASQIADDLGGVSRNAVIGKAHRLGPESRPWPAKPGEGKEKKADAKRRRPRRLRRRPRLQSPAQRRRLHRPLRSPANLPRRNRVRVSPLRLPPRP